MLKGKCRAMPQLARQLQQAGISLQRAASLRSRHPAPAAPPQVIEGLLHQGCKMILGGTSKSNKSWCLLDLAMSVASGEKWWGHRCARMPVVYINFELPRWSIGQRINALAGARPECQGLGDTLALWNLRGRSRRWMARAERCGTLEGYARLLELASN